MKVNQLMTNRVETCTTDTNVSEVAQVMARLNCGIVPIVEGDKLVGMITDRDIVLRCVAKGSDLKTTRAADCMTQPVVTASADMDAHKAAELMADKQIRRLPVVEGGRLVGIIALGDMATVNIHVDEAGQALSDISTPSRPGAH